MPSSGYGIANLFVSVYDHCDQKGCEHGFNGGECENRAAQYVDSCARTAFDAGMFIEWLESFVAAWEATKDPFEAAMAGLIEWDL